MASEEVSVKRRTELYFSVGGLSTYCSKTMLTGKSQFHISTPWGFEHGSLVTGSKQVVHWTSETW
jgi:hypothetical protein